MQGAEGNRWEDEEGKKGMPPPVLSFLIPFLSDYPSLPPSVSSFLSLSSPPPPPALARNSGISESYLRLLSLQPSLNAAVL